LTALSYGCSELELLVGQRDYSGLRLRKRNESLDEGCEAIQRVAPGHGRLLSGQSQVATFSALKSEIVRR